MKSAFLFIVFAVLTSADAYAQNKSPRTEQSEDEVPTFTSVAAGMATSGNFGSAEPFQTFAFTRHSEFQQTAELRLGIATAIAKDRRSISNFSVGLGQFFGNEYFALNLGSEIGGAVVVDDSGKVALAGQFGLFGGLHFLRVSQVRVGIEAFAKVAVTYGTTPVISGVQLLILF